MSFGPPSVSSEIARKIVMMGLQHDELDVIFSSKMLKHSFSFFCFKVSTSSPYFIIIGIVGLKNLVLMR
jgi:hypothetical protein